MRITLNIEDDVLMATREIARQQGLSMGKVLSDLARESLMSRDTESSHHGVPLFPVRPDSGVASLELVNQLHEEDS